MILGALLNFLLPPRCPWCKSVGALHEQPICSVCLRDIRWSPGEWRSNKVPVHCDSIHAVALFQGRLREAVHQLKYNAEPFLAKSCAQVMLPVAKGLPECDMVMAVPLSDKRLKKRRYNQSEWLSRHIATALALPMISGVVTRSHSDIPQVGLGAAARWKNVQHQFAVLSRHTAQIRDRHLLIIDDVVTTGATLQALAQALKKTGAATVRALTLGQTV